jgi:trigger factor
MAERDQAGAALEDEQSPQSADAAGGDESGGEKEQPKLNLSVKIDTSGSCKRHITVTIPPEDIERYFDNKFKELAPTAQVPGFRPGRAPRKLVESRFRKEVTEQVKGALLVDSMAQVNEDHKLAAISEPDFDLDAVEVPTDGPMVFEFDLEVRPDFDMPNWKGLSIERPQYDFGDKDVDRRLQQMLAKYGQLVPFDGPADVGDYITCNLTFRHDGEDLSRGEEETIRIRPVLSFRDGNVEKFDQLMKGVTAGQTRVAKAKLSASAPNEALRGQEVEAVFEVLDVKKLELPELTDDVLSDLGDFASEQELREAILDNLRRQLAYHQQQRARQQITEALIKDANWELPPDLLKRQSQRELERSVLELRRSGFSEQEIRAHANQLRQNSQVSTARSLKEHFILERIAEEESIDAQEQDYEDEVALIALQSGEAPRKVRARLEKRGLWDVLRNQIIERKVIELVQSHAKFKDTSFKPDFGGETEAVDQAAGGGDQESDIPEAKKPDVPEALRTQPDRT